jgi:hypothetical protein
MNGAVYLMYRLSSNIKISFVVALSSLKRASALDGFPGLKQLAVQLQTKKLEIYETLYSVILEPGIENQDMPYSQFTTIGKVKQAFGIEVVEGKRFLPEVEPITPSDTLLNYLEQTLPLAIAVSTEKARSEGIIAPILVEVRSILNKRVSLFSGEEFNVDESVGLNGVCDFLFSGSSEQMEIEAPVLILVEAKKGDLKVGIGQCVAEMIAAQRFNKDKGGLIKVIYGSVTNGTSWRFMRLVDLTVEIDFMDYSVPPPDQVLGFLVWMIQNSTNY